MIRKHNITATLALAAFLTACSSEETTPTYTVGEADNAIVLSAGIMEGSVAHTRSAGYSNVDATTNHNNHLAFTSGTKAALRIDGTWTGHSPESVTQTTAATIDAETPTDSKHNAITMTNQRYWDDYGTADPSNKETGRAAGLTIYGAAVNGVTTDLTVSDFTALEWTLPNDQSNDWANKDLLISNNIKEGGPDDTYKFDEKASGKLLAFTHALSKITVRLIANDGFPTTGIVGATAKKFEATPEVKLTSNEGDATTNTEWPYTTGTVNVTTGGVTSQSGSSKVVMHTQSITDTNYTAIYDALVMPGSCFGTTDTDIIARINADGNIYYVTAEKIRAALTADANHSDFNTQPGYNYIITVKVNKTAIDVTATIVDWIDVEAEAETPLINVTGNVGEATADDNTKDRMNSFAFYLSDAAGASAATAYTKAATATKPDEGADGTTLWPFVDEDSNPTKLYWPNHKTHYYMRGVSPATTAVNDGKIAVTAGDYNSASFPSNLLVGAPVIAANTMCGNTDHTQVDMSEKGICAREGKINLTFNYMMSQIEVHLASEAGASHVNLENAKVEIVGGYTAGSVDIHTKTVTTSGSVADFTLNHVGTEDANYRHSIVVPQNLTTNLKFKVTIYKGSTDEVDDIYYATIKDIQVTENGTKKSITEWESGKHYVYTLNLKKTEINVTATITDWITVTASDNVWF